MLPMYWLKLNKKTVVFILLFVILSLPAIIGFLHAGFPLTDDGNWMIIRFSAFYEAMRSGQFPVRFLSRLNNGYGYPVSDFLYPGFMYLGLPVHIFGLNFIDTIKFLFEIFLIISPVFCFMWLKKFFDNISSLVGSIVYLYFPYHLFDAYKRGSLGEVLSLAVVPFIFWQIERRSIILSTLGIGLLILSHNTLAFLFMGLIVFYAALDLFITKQRKIILRFYVVSITLALGISAFFWIPAIYDLRYTVFFQTKVSDWNSYFINLNLIGLSTIFIILCLIALIIVKKIKFKSHRLTIMFLLLGIFSIFFASPVSSDLWKHLPVSFIQFPFRLLSLTIVCISFLGACLVSVFYGKKKILISGLIIVLALLSAKSFILPNNYQYLPDTFYSTNQDTTTVKNEYMPKWVKNVPVSAYTTKIENLNGKEKIETISITANKINFRISLKAQRVIQINTTYFPGWEAFVNGKRTNIMFDNSRGVMHIILGEGDNNVVIKFSETSIRFFSDLISIFSLFGLIFLAKTRFKL
jgi:hypothetical protein